MQLRFLRILVFVATPVALTATESAKRIITHEQLWLLERLGTPVPSKLVTFSEENHWILKGENSRYWFSEVHGWLAKWLQ